MTPDEFKSWLVVVFQLVNIVVSAGLWLYVRYGDRHAEIDRKFEALRQEFDTRMDTQDKAISHLRGVSERAPTHKDLSELYEKVNDTAKTVASMAGELRGVNDTLRLILSRITERGLK